jgi:uroporphyrinogen III methyltransferase/synthase
MKTGKVYLVGAGPGDPGLITQKGISCLSMADVVVYDHLLDEVLLSNAPADAEKIYVGKAAAIHAMEQDEINRLLVKKAKEGKVVVRLKGGDPFVLGRGGEEAEELVLDGVPFEIVPGVTSAIAVPAYAGIPVTHRAMASSFAVITGHEDPTKAINSIAWNKIATGVDTLVFLMAMKNLPDIVAKLIKYGRPRNTPVAVIKDGTRPEQKTVTGTLADIVEQVKKHKLGPPAVVVVGKVAGLRSKLRWFDNRPLSGKRVLVTRARRQASALSKLLAEKGAQSVELPAIDILPVENSDELDAAIRDLKSYHWVIFTSVNGVGAFFARLAALKLDSRALHGRKIGAIGPATAAALEAHGLTADYCPAVYTGAGMVEGLKKLKIAGKRFLLPRADIADKELSDGIGSLGGEAHDVSAYHTVSDDIAIDKAIRLITGGEIDVITFTSSSTVTNLISALGKGVKLPSKVVTACIGPKTMETALKDGLKVDILAKEQTIPGLVAAMEEYFSKEA